MKYEGSNDGYTASAGVPALIDLLSESVFFRELNSSLPQRVSNSSYDPAQFSIALIAGFLKGYDCLDDIAQLKNDPACLAKFEEIPSPRAMGDFLRDFTLEQRTSFNHLLTRQSFLIRQTLTKDQPVVIDMDSTAHVHSGKKIEGLSYNYKNEWCLDSLIAFDELGLCYEMELRDGSTFSSQGAGPMITRIFSNLDRKKKKFFRADSAFCNEEVMRACIERGATFSLTAHANMGWEEAVEHGKVGGWTPWLYSEQEQKLAVKQGITLPTIELGSYLYQPGWSDTLRFSVVVKRTWAFVKDKDKGQWKWVYYAVLTNRNLFTTPLQEVMAFHQKRGNSENFIREGKYGYDLKHFPCKKMNANHAYGLFALLVHNFIRTIAILDNPRNPHFAKKIRRKYVHIPGRVTHSGRRWKIKIPNLFMKEVNRLTHAWMAAFQPILAQAGSLA